jgi:hypothetical protein
MDGLPLLHGLLRWCQPDEKLVELEAHQPV